MPELTGETVSMIAPTAPAPTAPAEAKTSLVAPLKDAPAAPTGDEKKPEEEASGKRFAALRAQERKLQEQRRELAAEREALKPWQSAKAATATNPLAALEALGLTYEQLTDAVLASMGQKTAEVTPTTEQVALRVAEERIAAWKAEQETAKKAEEQARIDRTIEGHRAEIARVASADGDRYELTNAMGAHDQAWQHIEKTFYATGKLPTVGEALDHVEAQLEAEARKILGLKRFGATGTTTERAEVRPTAVTGSPTLTNRGAAEVSALQATRPRDDNESIKRASSLLKWG